MKWVSHVPRVWRPHNYLESTFGHKPPISATINQHAVRRSFNENTRHTGQKMITMLKTVQNKRVNIDPKRVYGPDDDPGNRIKEELVSRVQVEGRVPGHKLGDQLFDTLDRV